MIKVFIMQYGNNDLWYYTKESKDSLINNIKEYEDIDISAIYLFENIDKENIWLNFSDDINSISSYAFRYKGGVFKTLNIKDYIIKINKDISFISPSIFIEKEKNYTDDINFVILSGHGGLFESLLDMSNDKNFSINTQYLCSLLKENRIDILLLDMCAMNYIEIIYELLKDSKIANIILFNGAAPLEGIDINKLLIVSKRCKNTDELIERILALEEYSLIRISSERITDIEKLREKINTISLWYYLSGKGDEFKVEFFKKDIDKLVTKSRGYILNSIPLSILVYELNDNYEKELYKKFEFTTKYILSEIICRGVQIKSKDKYIILKEESLKHIIHLNNTNISLSSINKLYEKYIKTRKGK